MKSLLIKLLITILSALQLAICNDKILKFKLIEAKSNEPIKNTELNVNYYQMVYDGPPDLDFIQKVTTDDKGEFSLPQSIFGGREIGIEWNKKFRVIDFGIRSDSLMIFYRYKYGFSEVITITHYDMRSGLETNYNFSKDTVTSKFDYIKLIAYDNTFYRRLLKRHIIKNKVRFQSNQAKMWQYVWSDFQKAVKYETVPPFNMVCWSSFIIDAEQVIDFDIKTAFDVTKKIEDENKRYYFLYVLCWVVDNEKGDRELKKQIAEWIDNEVSEYYKKRKDLNLSVTNKNPQADEFAEMYLRMKSRLRNKE